MLVDVIAMKVHTSLHDLMPAQMDDEKATMLKLFSHPAFREGAIGPTVGPPYKNPDGQARKVHQMALTGMFVAAAIKELRQSVLPTMVRTRFLAMSFEFS